MADISKVTLLDNQTYNLKDANAVPKTRTINNKSLTNDIALTASDVNALPISGGTMTGALTLNGTPTANLHAATKKYVDDAVSNVDTLPDQTGQSGKFLTTNGTVASWMTANYQPKYTISTTTILASGWSNGLYSTLQTTYPAASYDLNLELNGDSITSAQQDAWNAAQIVGSATTNVLKALGEVPTIDIPVIVKVTPNTDTYLSDVESLLASI